MINHWSSGIRVDRWESVPTALIRNTENFKLAKYDKYGYQTAP